VHDALVVVVGSSVASGVVVGSVVVLLLVRLVVGLVVVRLRVVLSVVVVVRLVLLGLSVVVGFSPHSQGSIGSGFQIVSPPSPGIISSTGPSPRSPQSKSALTSTNCMSRMPTANKEH